MSFRLRTIFYLFALLVVAMATFGGMGIVIAALVLGFWTWMFHRPRGPATLIEFLIFTTLIGMIVALMLPAVDGGSRAEARKDRCRDHLTQLVMSLINRDQEKGALPPAYVTDPTGKRLLSWRVAILPYFEEHGLGVGIDYTKAWDDPINQPSLSARPIQMRCPNDYVARPTTAYFAIVGPQTAWPEAGARRLAEIRDGASNTILLMEAQGRLVNWAEPRDLSFDDAVDLLSGPISADDGHEVDTGFFYKPTRGRHVAFADGHVECLESPLDRGVAVALLTINGQEQIDPNAIDQAARPQLDFGKCFAFGVFVILAVLPAAWLRRRGV